MNKLQKIVIRGFKSIQSMEIELQPLNLLIGANGAGKSNLISFFKMLNEMMAGRFQQYVGVSGNAQSLLHFGPKITREIEAKLEFEVKSGIDTYDFRLFYAAGDTLIFAEETLSFLQKGRATPKVEQLGAGHQEAKIRDAANEDKQPAKTLKYLLDRCRVYHFHDTSLTAGVRLSSYIGDNRWLMPDASNAAAMLLRFRKEHPTVYQRIVGTIRLIAPFFDDFVLNSDESRFVMLNWQEKGADRVFGPHQFSDGTLRAICLAILLLQPEDELPELIVIDEPELGLHPYAINIIADLLRRAALHTQILISTQSSSFLNHFEPDNIITVQREGKGSQFTRLNPTQLDEWLEEYALGEIWEKNVIGGGPH